MEKSLLNDATSQDDTPTPGYMLNEISRATIANYQACVQLQDFIINRIKKSNHNIKYKCLMIIKHVCRTGRPEFKREMGRHLEPIKECLQFRGPPDPLRGDEPYRRVRDAAKETLDAIFDSQMPQTTSSVAAANRIQGMGGGYDEGITSPQNRGGPSMMSSVKSVAISAFKGEGTESRYAAHSGDGFKPPSSGGSGSSGGYGGAGGSGGFGNSGGGGGGYSAPSVGGSSGKMIGLGNPNFSDARTEKSWVQVAGEVSSSTWSSVSSTIGNMAQGDKKSLTEYDGYSSNRGPNAFGADTRNTYNPSGVPGSGGAGPTFNNSFGGAGSQVWQSPSSTQAPGLGQGPGPSAGGSQQFRSIVPDMPQQQQPGSGRVGGAASDGAYERAMIEGLCEPGGLKTVPAEDKLQSFLSVAPTLTPEVVGSCLLELLNSDAWQSRTKALMVISALVKAKSCYPHATWWSSNGEEIKGLLGDAKASVRTQASKTLRVLKIEHTPGAAPPSGGGGGGGGGGGSASLDVGDFSLIDDDSMPSAPAPPVPQAPSGPTGGDMFAGMSLGTAPAPAPAPQAPVQPSAPLDAFSFLQASTAPAPAPPVPTPPPQPQALSTFDFLSVSTQNPQAPPPPPTPTPMPTYTPAPAPAPFQAQAPLADIFGDLNLSVQSSAPVPDRARIPSTDLGSFADLEPSRGLGAAPTATPYGGGGFLPQQGFPQQGYPQQGFAPGYPPMQQPQQGFPGGFAPQMGYPQQQRPGAYPAQVPMPGQFGQQGPRGMPAQFMSGMGGITAPRKIIPDGNQSDSSGFGFLGGGGAGGAAPGRQGDSFSFIADEVKANANRK